ncbi:MAG: 3'-5' exonuclease [Trueperaceae bacterium]|nr:3'-5' exonuclease [Trueperaceae bacterium]
MAHQRGLAFFDAGRREDHFLDANWPDRPIVAFDLETTGVDPHEARIVTWAWAVVHPDGDANAESGLVKPDGFEIPEGATAVHGISTEVALAEGKSLAQALTILSARIHNAAITGKPLAIFNAPYDITVFEAELARVAGVSAGEVDHTGDYPPIIDPLVLDRRIEKYRKGKRQLGILAPTYGVELAPEEAHSATADAIAAGRLALAMAAQHPDALRIPALHLHERQVAWAETQTTDFEAYLRRSKSDPTITLGRGWPRQHPVST